MTEPRIRTAGDSAILLELEPMIDPRVNERAIGIARLVRDRNLPGVRDVVPTYRSVAVHFNPLAVDFSALESALEEAGRARVPRVQGTRIEVPVHYGGAPGPDLAEVARLSGLTEAEVIERHAVPEYRVFMLGFLPGFAYLGTVDERLVAPRRESPRLRVAAGSVGIAGRQTGIYPRDSPGGWQIIGRTALCLFDPERTPAALLAAGDMVTFVPVRESLVASESPVASGPSPTSDAPDDVSGSSRTTPPRHLTILRPGLLTTIQDAGRWGHQASGVPVAGPLDVFSHRLANILVGNEDDAATLEITVIGPEIRFDGDALVAIAGADLDATVDGGSLPLNRAVVCRAGSVFRCGTRQRGARVYLAIDGGIAVRPVLGSRATHVLSGVGGIAGRALAAGDRLPLGPPARSHGPPSHLSAGRSHGTLGAATIGPHGANPHTGGARLRLLRGPHDEAVSDEALDMLQRTRFLVGAQSNRMGYRLTGGRIARVEREEMISTATFAGALQLPPSGEPILLMSDRQTTGGYPQIATVITADQPLAGQLAPGDWVEFEICSRRDAIAALVQQEGQLLAIG